MGRKKINPYLDRPDMYVINQYQNVVDKILVTMTPTASFTAGITLTFDSGTLTIDWKDGSAPENFTSDVEKTHLYASAGTYIAEISGNLSSITSFDADTSKIALISGFKTGLLTLFDLVNNVYNGVLDLSNAPIAISCNVGVNSNLTQVIFASSGNSLVTFFVGYLTKVSTYDFTNVPIGGVFYAYIISTLTTLTFAPSGNGALTDFRVYNTNIPPIDFLVFASSNGSSIRVSGNSWTATEHDNQLINLDATGWINGTLNIIAGNTARTSASDAAYNNLIAKGWTIT